MKGKVVCKTQINARFALISLCFWGFVISVKGIQVDDEKAWRINDNNYKLDLPSEYNVSVTLNIFYLVLLI